MELLDSVLCQPLLGRTVEVVGEQTQWGSFSELNGTLGHEEGEPPEHGMSHSLLDRQ